MLAAATRRWTTRQAACSRPASTASHSAVLSALSKESFGLLTEPSDIEKYSIDWLGQFGSPALAVIRPSSTEAVAEAVRHCGEHGVPIVPQGGNTGLVSGGVPRRPSEEVVLSLERMASIQSFDEDSGIVVAEAGCTLGSLDAWLRENHGRCMPLDLGSKGSCMLGGNLATAAGGISMVRYGSLHASLVGMRVVLASGQVVDGLRTAQKSNVGYHWPHLFVGSEGTLGIITAAAIKTPPAPAHTATAMLAFEKWDQLRACVRRAMGAHGLAETLGALEYVDAATVDLGTAWNPQAKRFDEDDWPYALLVEAAGSSQSHCESRLEAVLQGGIAAGDIGFGVVAASDRQREAMWRLREGATGALNHRGPGLKFDVSLPLRLMAGPDGLVAAARTRLESVVGRSMMSAGKVVGGGWGYEGSDEGGIVVCGYGHVGDGNLHLNVSIPSAAAASGDAWKTHASGDTMHCVHSSCSAPLSDVVSQAKDAMLPWLAEWVAERGGAGGSVSAEHGVGLSKLDYAGLSRGTGEEELMRQIKQAMDPRHLLNPGRVLNSD